MHRTIDSLAHLVVKDTLNAEEVDIQAPWPVEGTISPVASAEATPIRISMVVEGIRHSTVSNNTNKEVKMISTWDRVRDRAKAQGRGKDRAEAIHTDSKVPDRIDISEPVTQVWRRAQNQRDGGVGYRNWLRKSFSLGVNNPFRSPLVPQYC